MMKSTTFALIAGLLVLGLLPNQGQAQQDVQTSIYTTAPLPFNPAYAGLSKQSTVRSISRLQWVGWGGAPTTQILSFDAPFFRDLAGAGMTLIQDNIGARTHTSIMASGAAHVPVGDQATLSFGLTGGFRFNSYDFSGLQVDDPSDDLYTTQFQDWSPNFGAGVYLTTEKFFAGYSVPHILLEQLSDSLNGDNIRRHHYAMAGIKTLDDKLRITGLLKATQDAPIAVDLNALYALSSRFSLGGMVRVGESLGMLMQFGLAPNLLGMYCIEMPYNNLRTQNFGTHELGLIWTPNHKAVVNPRYF